MAYFETRAASYPGSGGWNADTDAAILELSNILAGEGWSVLLQAPYSRVVTTSNMVSFGGSFPLFWQVAPPSGGSYPVEGIPLVIDAVPPAWSPPPGYFVAYVTGSTSKAATLAGVLDVMQTYYSIEVLFTDYAASDPYAFVKRLDADPAQLANVPIPGAAVALNTSCPNASQGGYTCRCVQNGTVSTSVFIYRNSTTGIDPYYPSFAFAPDFTGVAEPILENMTVGTDVSGTTVIQFTRSNCVIAAGPQYFMLAQISGGYNGHLEMAALDPVENTGIEGASFSVASSGGGGGADQFRNRPLASPVNGYPCYQVDREIGGLDVVYTWSNPSNQLVRVQTLFTGPQGTAELWENGLGQIVEAWVAFEPDPAATTPVQVLGRLPGAIVIHQSLAAATTPAFIFNNDPYQVFTNNVTISGSEIGTICFRAESAAAPTCPTS